MKSHTATDIEFMRRVAERLEIVLEKEQKKDSTLTVQKFAASLGVTLPGLQKYRLKKSVPTLDFLARAHHVYGLDVTYGSIHLDDEFFRHRVTKAKAAPAVQMILPLAIEALSEKNIEFELKPGPRKAN